MSFEKIFEVGILTSIIAIPFLIALMLWGPGKLIARYQAGEEHAQETVIDGVFRLVVGGYFIAVVCIGGAVLHWPDVTDLLGGIAMLVAAIWGTRWIIRTTRTWGREVEITPVRVECECREAR